MNLSVAKFEHAVARRITHSPRVELGRATLAVGLTVCIALMAFAMHMNLASGISILLLATVVVSIHWGVVQGTAASLAAVGCLDFLFTPPFFQLSVHDGADLVALIAFEGTALLVSRLAWKERVHAEEQEYQRRGISKLYQLSNAILLVDRRGSTLDQLCALMRDIFAIESVKLWVSQEERSSSEIAEVGVLSNSAHSVYTSGKDLDSIEEGWSHRVLRMGTSPFGGMVLQGWEVDPALADAAGALVAIAIERERSAQKENRAEAARNTEQLRTAVLDALAHAFKTPLTAILTASSGLLAIGRLGEAQTELVEIIDHEVALLANLTTRLLKTAALDAKEIRVRSSTVSLLPLVESLIREQDLETRRRIHVEKPASLNPVRADAQLLTLALAQLLDNAAKYSFVGTEIEISFVQDDAQTVITVSNQGEPIDPENSGLIFERYHRGSQAGRGPTGTGLGLSIVKKIAEAHGGDAFASCQGSRTNISMSLMGGARSIHG